MKVLHSILIVPAILAAACIVSCGGGSDSSSSTPWYTDIKSGSTDTATLPATGDTYKVYRIYLSSGYSSISLSGLTGDCGFDIYSGESITSLDALKNADAFASIDVNCDSTSEFTNISAGTAGYGYLVVYNDSSTAAAYTLNIDTASVTDWYSPLTIGTGVSGNLNPAYEIIESSQPVTYYNSRLYKITIATAGTYTFEITGSTNGYVAVAPKGVTMYGPGNQFKTPTLLSTKGNGVSGALTAGDYLVVVQNGSDTDTDAYTLTVTSAAAKLGSSDVLPAGISMSSMNIPSISLSEE